MGQRYQREIEEILGKANEKVPAEAGTKRGLRPRLARAGAQTGPERRPRFSFDLSPGRLFLIGLVVLVGVLLATMFGFGFAAPFAWIGIGLFVVAYIRFFTKPRRNVDRRWRGQSIEDPPPPSSANRLWRWISGG